MQNTSATFAFPVADSRWTIAQKYSHVHDSAGWSAWLWPFPDICDDSWVQKGLVICIHRPPEVCVLHVMTNSVAWLVPHYPFKRSAKSNEVWDPWIQRVTNLSKSRRVSKLRDWHNIYNQRPVSACYPHKIHTDRSLKIQGILSSYKAETLQHVLH